MNILHISSNFNYSCGISKYLEICIRLFASTGKHRMFFITNGGDSLERISELGVNVDIMKFDKGLKNIFYLHTNVKYLTEYCSVNKIDVIHSHHRYLEYVAYQVSKKINVKTITTAHSLVNGLNRFSYRSDKVIAVSNAVKKNIIENFNISTAKIEVLNNCIERADLGVNVNHDEVRAQYGIPYEKKIILFAGRMSLEKGIPSLIDAFITLQNNFDVVLVLVGSIEENIKGILAMNKNQNIIIIPPQKDLSALYFISDIVVLPSLKESFPYTMLEAGLFKKAFVGCNNGGMKEFIENGVNGFLVENENSEQLTGVLRELILNSKRREDVGCNLFEKVYPHTDLPKHYQSLIKIYQSSN